MAGGTWLACTRDGKVAFITNVREVQKLAQAKSRGDLPVRFLEVIILFDFVCFASPTLYACLIFSTSCWQEVLFAYTDGILGTLVSVMDCKLNSHVHILVEH